MSWSSGQCRTTALSIHRDVVSRTPSRSGGVRMTSQSSQIDLARASKRSRRKPTQRPVSDRSPSSRPVGASSPTLACVPSPTKPPWQVPTRSPLREWVVAHSLGVGAITLLAAGMLGPYLRFAPTAESRSRWTPVPHRHRGRAGPALPRCRGLWTSRHRQHLPRPQRDAGLFTTLTDGVRWGSGIWFLA